MAPLMPGIAPFPGGGRRPPGRSRRRSDAQGSLLTRAGLAALVLLTLSGTHGAYGSSPSEYEVKAAFVVNFARYVDWPADAYPRSDAPFVIGIVGKDPFGGAIDRASQGKAVAGHQFTVRRLRSDQDVKGCHILFVASSEADRVAHIIGLAKGQPVLTVGELPNFCQAGGVINLLADGGQVRIEINVEAAQRARLAISARLLGLAKRVKDAGK